MQLTPAQNATLFDAINAEPSLAAALAALDDSAVAAWLNAKGAFVVWKNSVTVREVGDAFVSTAVSSLTTANTSRLQVMQMYSGGTFNPSKADTRAAFDDVFSAASGTSTKANLLALWKRTATKAESLLADGVGSVAAPATLAVEGVVTLGDVARILRG